MAPKKAGTRSDRKEATRRRLLEACKKVAAKRPLEVLQIDDITQEAGLAHGTFYVHFASKEELFAEMIERFNTKLREVVIARWDEAFFTDPAAVLQNMADAFLDRLRRDRALVRAFAAYFSHGVPAVWLHEGINPPMVGFVLDKMTLAGIGAKGEVDPAVLLHGILGLWARIGFRHALAARPNHRQTAAMLAKMTLGALSPFLGALS